MFFATSKTDEGFSQSDINISDSYRLDLSKLDWYAYNDNFGTSEEKKFVKTMQVYIDKLKVNYKQVFLIRNEKDLKIYSFKSGEAFYPDYVLILGKGDLGLRNYEQIQVFIEPKGDMLLEKDAWKEDFLCEMKDCASVKNVLAENDEYRVWGFHFYNDNKKTQFISDLEEFI